MGSEVNLSICQFVNFCLQPSQYQKRKQKGGPRTDVELTFDHLPKAPTMNSRTHWARRKDAAQAAHRLVQDAVTGVGGPPPTPYTGAGIHLVFFLPDRRRRDLDNLVAAAKSYIDGLVHAQVLTDDSPDVVDWMMAEVRLRPREPGMVIRVRPRN